MWSKEETNFLRSLKQGDIFVEIREPALVVGPREYSVLMVDRVLKTKLVCTEANKIYDILFEERSKSYLRRDKKSVHEWNKETQNVIKCIKNEQRAHLALLFIKGLKAEDLTPEFIDSAMKLRQQIKSAKENPGLQDER